MEQNWKALADAVRASRIAMGLTQEGLATKVGVSRVTIQNLESGTARTRVSSALLKVARALDWPNGRIEDLLSGGPPLASRADHQRRIDAARQRRDEQGSGDIPLRISEELKQGRTYDAQVLDLPGASGARMVIVVKGDEDASPEEIQEALTEWRRAARRMAQPEAGDE